MACFLLLSVPTATRRDDAIHILIKIFRLGEMLLHDCDCSKKKKKKKKNHTKTNNIPLTTPRNRITVAYYNRSGSTRFTTLQLSSMCTRLEPTTPK